MRCDQLRKLLTTFPTALAFMMIAGCGSSGNGLASEITVELPDGTTTQVTAGAGVITLADTSWEFFATSGSAQGLPFVTINFGSEGELKAFENNTSGSEIFGTSIIFDGQLHATAQDGLSYAPLGADDFRMYRLYLSGLLGLPPDDLDMSSIAAAREHYDGKACNVVQLVPHGAVRIGVVGFHDTPLRGDLLVAAEGIVRQGIADGARGFSTGLSYYPNSYSDSDELIALNTAVAEAGGVYVVHVRNHNDDRAPYGTGITEALEIGRRSGVKVHVSHYRTQPSTAGDVEELMTEIDAAKRDGVDVSLECYPYPAGSTVPGWRRSSAPPSSMAGR